MTVATGDKNPFRTPPPSSGGGSDDVISTLKKIAESGKATSDAITKLAAASGVSTTSVSGSSRPTARPTFGSGLSSSDVAHLGDVISAAIKGGGGGRVRGSSGPTAGTYPVSGARPQKPTIPIPTAASPPPPRPVAPPAPPASPQRFLYTPGMQPPGFGGPFAGIGGPSSGGGFAGGQSAAQVARTMGRTGGAGAGAAEAGAAGALGKAAPWIAALEATAKQVTSIGNTLQDPFATPEQTARSLFKKVPGGETALALKDMITGRAAGMEKASLEGEQARAGVRGELEKSAFQLQFAPQQRAREAFATIYARQSAIVPGVFDRTTTQGRTEYENAQRLLPLRKDTAKAEREASVATATRLESERQLAQLQSKENSLIRERSKLEKEMSEGGSGVERKQQLERFKTISEEIQGTNQQVKSAKQQVVTATREEIAARGEQQKARVREEKLGQAINIEARAQRIESTAGRLGEMDPFQQQRALTGIKHIQSLGTLEDLQRTPDFIREEARAAFPEEYAAQVNKLTVESSVFRQAQAQGGLERSVGAPGETFGDLYKRADTLKEEAAKEEHAIEQKSAGAAAKAGADLGTFMANEVNKFVENAKAALVKRFEELRQNL